MRTNLFLLSSNVKDPKSSLKTFIYCLLGSNKIVTFAIGFPGVYAQEQAKKYKVNKTYYQLHMIDEAEGEEDEE